MKNKKYLLIILAVFLMTSGFSCKLFPKDKAPKELTEKINLSYWGVWETSADLQPLINDFQALHPNISVTYRKLRYQEYEQKMLEGWAEDAGPDLYSIPVEWLKKYQNRITPQPDSVQLAFQEVTKTLGKTDVATVVRQVAVTNPADVKNRYVDTVNNDIIINKKIYGLPLSLDTLVLIYNRDLLDAAGVATPPANWTELKDAVKKTTQLNLQNTIIQSGAALGTGQNIPRAIDIVSLLMMQNGAAMTSGNQASFFGPIKGGADKSYSPGYEALRFYTDFADSAKEVYTWNSGLPDAIDAFIAGKVAMIYGYAYQLPTIKGRAPKLNIALAPMTQIQGSSQPLNYANYWITTVSHKVKNVDAAWGFLNFIAQENEAKKFLITTKRPAALRSLINEQRKDPELGVFANQALTATRWYFGRDPLKMEMIFLEMIDRFSSFTSTEELNSYLNGVMARINLTL